MDAWQFVVTVAAVVPDHAPLGYPSSLSMVVIGLGPSVRGYDTSHDGAVHESFIWHTAFSLRTERAAGCASRGGSRRSGAI
jgi:hypothetical protein